MINEQEIRRWWAVFKNESPLTEIRIIGNNKTFSGYYADVDSLIRDVSAYDGFGIYATINAIKDACYSRAQHNTIVQKPKETTSDIDIDFRTTILIDLDPNRPSGVNATDKEIKAAYDKAAEVFKFLNTQGFERPVIAFSGNGYHLYYKVCLSNNPEVSELVKDFLNALSMMFSDEGDGGVKVDTSVFNAGRIAKVIGTTSNKGASTDDRPQRISSFYYIPREYKVTDIAYIRKVAAMLPKPEQPSKYNNFQPRRFDVRAFIAEHNIDVVKEARFGQGTKFVLKECPFDPNHHKDAAVFALDNGACGFSCFHASCQQYHWRDFVLHYDPTAYDKSAWEDFARRKKYTDKIRQEDIRAVEEDSRGKKWMQAAEFKYFDLKDAIAIPFGFPALDKKILGLILGEVSIVSGSSGSGKTTFINHIILSAVQRNFKVALWSGEMAGGRIVGWLDQMAAGKQNVFLVEGTEGIYYVPQNIRNKINAWLGDRLYIYNNSYGQKWSQLSADIREHIEVNKPNLVIVDNLMAVDLDIFTGENNDKQKSFINELTDLAAKTNTHIILVAHPRKENLSQLIRKESIAGTADLTNLAFNVFLLHRTGQDFEKRGKEFFGVQRVMELMDYSVVVEVAKARTTGYQDLTVGLYYEPSTRRLKDNMGDNTVYGWDDEKPEPPIQQTKTELSQSPDDDLPPDEQDDPYYNRF